MAAVTTLTYPNFSLNRIGSQESEMYKFSMTAANRKHTLAPYNLHQTEKPAQVMSEKWHTGTEETFSEADEGVPEYDDLLETAFNTLDVYQVTRTQMDKHLKAVRAC